MPKKEHVHIVTDEKHKELLADLGEKYGSMTKAFEFAIEFLEKTENIGSCDNCEIKFEAEQSNLFREFLNMVSFSADNIREINRYIQGDCTLSELLNQTREKAYQFGKEYLSYVRVEPKNSYDTLLMMIEEWKRRTRLLKSIQVNKFANKIIVQVNVFEKNPVFVVMGLIGYLQALGLTFDINSSQEEIIITWIHPERFPTEKPLIEAKISSFINAANQKLKPYLFKQGFLPVMPELLEWISATTLDYEMIPLELSFNFISKFLRKKNIELNSAEQWANFIKYILETLNYATQIKIKSNEKKKSFKINMECMTPSLTKFLLQQNIVTLAKYGWKLKSHKIDHKQLSLTFNYVGEDDSTILEPLYFSNFGFYLNQRFQTLRMIPVDEYEDLANFLYKADLDQFHKVYYKQGIKFANAIKLLGNNDLLKMREIGLHFIPQLIKITQRDPKEINFLAEPNKFTIIFKTTKLVEMESMKAIFVGVMEGFGYFDVQPKMIENIVTIEFKRPQKIDGNIPVVEIKSEEEEEKKSEAELKSTQI